MNFNNPPTERTARRAVTLWKRMLTNPKYDYLGEHCSREDAAQHFQMEAMGISPTKLPNNSTSELLDAFGDELYKRLMDDSLSSYERKTLGVDYGPDKILAEAASSAGLKMEFPYKTMMWVHDEYISVRYGYGADIVNHYPLSNNRWLVTTLSGEPDLKKLLEFVQRGGNFGLLIEAE